MAAWLVVLSGPAMAQGFFDRDNDDHDHGFVFDRDNDDNDIFDNDNGFFFNNNDRFDRGDFFNRGFDNAFDIDQDIGPTGDVDLNSEIVNTGNNSNQCAAPLQFGNTGNFQNTQGFSQLNSFADDIEFDGGSFEFLPEQAVDCGQGVFQSAASG